MKTLSEFDWDKHNAAKCQKHGVSLAEIESLFNGTVMVTPDVAHADAEERFKAIGKTPTGRYVFLVFTLRGTSGAQTIRPISARYMHMKEVRHYEKANSET